MSSKDSALALKELRQRGQTIADIRASLFPEQINFIDDPAKLKTALCTRRAGKSYTDGAYFCIEALKLPGCTLLYIATTKVQAKRIMLKDILKVINKKFRLGIKFNHTDLECHFPNGSILYLMGMDATPEEMDKAFGQKYKLVVIDEGGSWKQDQEQLVHEILEPACADLDGSICMTGSPVRVTQSYFFRITYKEGNVPGWSNHRWTWEANPHVRVNMQKQIDRKISVNPRVVETAPYKRMYLGQWIVDPGALVYKYTAERNDVAALPTGNTYSRIVGIDLGYVDATAFIVGAYSQYDPNLYFEKVIKLKGLDITGVAQQLEFLRVKYNPVHWIVDGASKQAVEELKNRHGFPLEAADKMGKADMIEIMNADFTMGRIKLLPGTEQLKEEYANLIWDPESKKREEHPGCENHAADGGLYVWRKSFHYLSQAKPQLIKAGSDEDIQAWWDRESQVHLKRQSEDPLMRDFGKEYGFKS